MNWKLEYLPEAEKDLKDLNGSQRILVLKAIKKVQQNPLPVEEQGYGKPLGNQTPLCWFACCISASPYRIVYDDYCNRRPSRRRSI